MIGLFINNQPVRVKVSPEYSLLPWLRDLQAQQSEAREFRHSSLAQILKLSDAPKGPPLFDSIFVFENFPVPIAPHPVAEAFEFSDIQFSVEANYPLTLTVVPGAELILRLEYNRGQFDTVRIARMMRHLEALLHSMIGRPDARLYDLKQEFAEAERLFDSEKERELEEARLQKYKRLRQRPPARPITGE